MRRTMHEHSWCHPEGVRKGGEAWPLAHQCDRLCYFTIGSSRTFCTTHWLFMCTLLQSLLSNDVRTFTVNECLHVKSWVIGANQFWIACYSYSRNEITWCKLAHCKRIVTVQLVKRNNIHCIATVYSHGTHLPKKPPTKWIPLVVYQCLHCWVQGNVLSGSLWTRRPCNCMKICNYKTVQALMIRIMCMHTHTYTHITCATTNHTVTVVPIYLSALLWQCSQNTYTHITCATTNHTVTVVPIYLSALLWQCSQKWFWLWLKESAIRWATFGITLHYFTIDASVGQHKVIQYGKSGSLYRIRELDDPMCWQATVHVHITFIIGLSTKSFMKENFNLSSCEPWGASTLSSCCSIFTTLQKWRNAA